MAPPAPLFEFAYHDSVTSLEAPLGQPTSTLERLAAKCDAGENYERHFLWVRKRLREISIPDRQLNALHGRINSLMFPIDLAMGKEVNGFVARRSTLTNATPHVGASYLQKFDIKDFFTSITTAQVAAALCDAGFGTDAASMLGRLVSCEGRIPLGARTSPRISNLVLRPFDEAMVALAAEHALVYTRYADDLSFSAQEVFDVSAVVRATLSSSGFDLNESKTKSFKRGQPMFVTGLAISDHVRPRLRKRLKAQLRREFYFVEKHGLAEHADAIGEDRRATASRMKGQLHYARSIEPDFSAKLEAKYPNAFALLIPKRSDDRIERAQRRRQQFLDRVAMAPRDDLPFYTPTISLLA